MSTIPSFFTTLFCAFVLLVQQRAGASEGYDRYSEMFTEAMEAAAAAIAVAAELTEEKITVEEAAKKISRQADTLTTLKAQLTELASELSEEDQTSLNEEFRDDEVLEAFILIDDGVEAFISHFEENDYYDSDKLRTACEEFTAAYQ